MPSILTVCYPENLRAKYAETKKLLSDYGVTIDSAGTMADAMATISRKSYNIILINSDENDYLTHLQTMRQLTTAFIAVIASKDNYKEKIAALTYGADSYAVRQGTKEEQIAWAMSVIRRFSCFSNRIIIMYNDICVDVSQRKAFVKDKEISLRRKEFDILHYLVINAEIVLSYKQIFKYVWGEEYTESSSNLLWPHIKRLRSKIRAVSDIEYIQTVRGVGYCLKIIDGNRD